MDRKSLLEEKGKEFIPMNSISDLQAVALESQKPVM
jgi:hypothetical protein